MSQCFHWKPLIFTITVFWAAVGCGPKGRVETVQGKR